MEKLVRKAVPSALVARLFSPNAASRELTGDNERTATLRDGKSGPASYVQAFWPPLLCVVLLVSGLLQIASLRDESQTHDEAAHLVAGYTYWITADFRLDVEHPPLLKLIAALPLLILKPDFSRTEMWERGNEYEVGREFLYSNRMSGDTILTAARITAIVFSLALVCSVACWTRYRFGATAAAVATILVAFEPSVLAHGRYVTTDIPVTLVIWLSCISWFDYLLHRTTGRLLRTGLIVGLALGTKYSALFLYPVFLATWFTHRGIEKRPITRQDSDRAKILPALVLLPFLVIWALYFFDTRALSEDPVLAPRLASAYPADGSTRSAIVQSILRTPIPAYYYFRGLQLLIRDDLSGQRVYLLGNVSDHSSWRYFPIAFLVKEPVGLLLLLLIAVVLACRARRNADSRLALSLVLIPAGLYLLISMTSSFNIGIRHLLPIYPFLCVFIGVVLAAACEKFKHVYLLAGCLTAVVVVESCMAYPHYLSFFNVAVGGGANGSRYLLDSNLDWGQDLKRLKRWIDERGAHPLCLSYFGTAVPDYYGIDYSPLGAVHDESDLKTLNCVVAISAEHLFGLKEQPFRGLRSLAPTDRVGHSIYIYDLRPHPQTTNR